MNRNMRVRKLVVMAVFVAIELMLGMPGSPLQRTVGLIQVGVLAATTLHIPVILAALLEGPWAGMVVGGAFGLCSFLGALTNPVGLGVAFQNPVVAFVPRIILGLVAGLLPLLLKKMKRIGANSKNASAKRGLGMGAVGITTGVSTLLHTAMVFGTFYFFSVFMPSFSLWVKQLNPVLYVVLLTNTLPEIVLAIVVVTALYRALQPLYRNLPKATYGKPTKEGGVAP